MALKDDDKVPEAEPVQACRPLRHPPRAQDGRPAPLWVVPLYVVGFVLVYLGERARAHPMARYVATFAGLGAVSAASVVRFMPKFRVGGERSDIEKPWVS